MFTYIREEFERKIRDIKVWIQSLDENEVYTKTYKGFFFVYIYGIWEDTISSVVENTIECLNNADTSVLDVAYSLYPLVFSKEYDALYNAGDMTKWQKRQDISKRFDGNNKIVISTELMPTDGRNIRYRQLESIAFSFGIKSSVLPRNEIGGYLDEIVRNRNAIAHGNKLPADVGANYSVQDLNNRCEILSEIGMHVINCYEQYISNKEYLKNA